MYIDGTTAVLSVTYRSSIAEDPDDLELSYTYDPPEGTGNPESPVQFSEAVRDLTGVETRIELTGLKENTQYQYNISLVRRSDGATIGVSVSGEFIVGGKLLAIGRGSEAFPCSEKMEIKASQLDCAAELATFL